MLDGERGETSINWWILGGGLVFAAFSLTMGLPKLAPRGEMIFLAALAGVTLFMWVAVRERQARNTLVAASLVVLALRASLQLGSADAPAWWGPVNQEIVFARLCTAFAALALTIACVGLYATMAYSVARRTREIGLRMALGAGRGEVVWMVLRDVCWLAAVGLPIGVPIALGASRLVESLLFETKPNDPRVLVAAVAILLAAALAAGYGPARRASRVEPMTALRHE